jgi:predicted HicB family RNase H-like nuclease
VEPDRSRWFLTVPDEENPNTQSFLVRLPPDLHEALAAEADSSGLSMAEVARAALREHLGDDHENPH